jgi:hypothetical protein
MTGTLYIFYCQVCLHIKAIKVHESSSRFVFLPIKFVTNSRILFHVVLFYALSELVMPLILFFLPV